MKNSAQTQRIVESVIKDKPNARWLFLTLTTKNVIDGETLKSGLTEMTRAFNRVFKYKKVHFFDALVGYFRASGYFRIRKFIQQTPKIRILVGINVDKLTYQANQQGLLFNPNAEQSQEEFFNDIKRNIQEAK